MNDEDDAALDDEDEDTHPDQRKTKRRWDQHIEKNNEYESDSEDEEENEAHGVRRQPGASKRRNVTDYRNEDEEMVSGADTPPQRTPSRNQGLTAANGANGTGPHTANGSVHSSSNGDNPSPSVQGSDLESQTSEPTRLAPNENNDEDRNHEANEYDEDAEMGDDDQHNDNGSHGRNDTAGNGNVAQLQSWRPGSRQEATPPDSPPQIAVAPTAPQAAASITAASDEVMGEEDVAEEKSDLAKEVGREERDLEDVRGEKVEEVEMRGEE